MIHADDKHTAEYATARGAQLAAEWQGGIASCMRMCRGLRDGVLSFEGAPALLNAFLAPLVGCGVLTQNDALLGRSSAKISMLMQIAEHEHLLLRLEIARHLANGFTIAYQACVIFKRLPGKEEEKVNELARILAECPDDGAREYLLGVTRRLKRDAAAERAPQQADAQATGDAPPTGTLGGLIDGGRRFDLIVVTPEPAEFRLLGEDYHDEVGAEESTLARLLPIRRVVDGDAAIIVAAPHRDFPVVANKLLDLCGFSRPSRVLLTRPTTSRDITDAEVIVIAKRGDARLNLPEDGSGDEEGALEPLEAAARLCPDAAHRLHLFASAQTQGWCCVPVDGSWLERPSVR